MWLAPLLPLILPISKYLDSRQIRYLPAYQVGLWSLPTDKVGPRNLRNQWSVNNLRLRKITYEIITLFLQNEPKFGKSQVNVNVFITSNYEQMDTWSIRKNEPNLSCHSLWQSRNKPNFPPIFIAKTGKISYCVASKITYGRF
jgi:hypothetical protein